MIKISLLNPYVNAESDEQDLNKIFDKELIVTSKEIENLNWSFVNCDPSG